ncbi:hypothetical protein SprV_0200705600 [Sparganum proliferum]
MGSRHEDVTCDACNQSSFQLRRYKCLRCFDYDLCGDCFDNERESIMHSKTHPMQCLLLEADKDIFFQNDKSRFKAQSHTCPICGALGFREAELATHVFTEHPPGHPSAKTEVICPICASSSDGSPNLQTQSFAQHLTSKHRLKKLAKPSSPTEEEAGSTAPKPASQSSGVSCRSSQRSHPLLPHPSSLSANSPSSWNVFGSPCNPQRNSLTSAVATADDELTHLFSLQSIRKVLTTPPRRPSTSDRSKCLQVTPSFSIGKASPLSGAATRQLSTSSLATEKHSTEATALSAAPAVTSNGATANAFERKHTPSESQTSQGTPSSDPLGGLNSAQATPNASVSNPRIVNSSNGSATNSPQGCTDRQAQNAEVGPTAGVIDDTNVSLKLDSLYDPDQVRNPPADTAAQDELSHSNLVSVVLNSSDGSERGKLEVTKSTKVSAATPSSSCDASTTPFSKPGKKSTTKEPEDRSTCLSDTFDPEWSSFLHELIWQSLQIPYLSNLTAEPAQPDGQPKAP